MDGQLVFCVILLSVGVCVAGTDELVHPIKHVETGEDWAVAPDESQTVTMSNKKLIDRCIRLLVELGHIDYEEAAQRIFAAQEWVASQDWSKSEEPSPVQVALKGMCRLNSKTGGQSE